jgi:hypothetical protein
MLMLFLTLTRARARFARAGNGSELEFVDLELNGNCKVGACSRQLGRFPYGLALWGARVEK